MLEGQEHHVALRENLALPSKIAWNKGWPVH
jgi:hypothetical protein